MKAVILRERTPIIDADKYQNEMHRTQKKIDPIIDADFLQRGEK
ncbi:MAG: hypothetical protein PHW48_02000 [Candidatus Pacebacteria bacterium]|jgi:hypothetical protein|nr:hypothetical protein [Candidatus Paceibacterota bacterium]MDD4664702.1 hypothetical protein [Candidatus Paceibacterota bacterium]